MAFTAEAGGDSFQFMREEAIGGLKIGMEREQALQITGEKPKAGKIEVWGADGLYHQQLAFKNAGITLNMTSSTKSSPQTIGSITATKPCGLATRRGIRIGSTEVEVMKAYKDKYNKEESTPGIFIAGSVYGGISFQFATGKVSQIFLGAAAE